MDWKLKRRRRTVRMGLPASDLADLPGALFALVMAGEGFAEAEAEAEAVAVADADADGLSREGAGASGRGGWLEATVVAGWCTRDGASEEGGGGGGGGGRDEQGGMSG